MGEEEGGNETYKADGAISYNDLFVCKPDIRSRNGPGRYDSLRFSENFYFEGSIFRYRGTRCRRCNRESLYMWQWNSEATYKFSSGDHKSFLVTRDPLSPN